MWLPELGCEVVFTSASALEATEHDGPLESSSSSLLAAAQPSEPCFRTESCRNRSRTVLRRRRPTHPRSRRPRTQRHGLDHRHQSGPAPGRSARAPVERHRPSRRDPDGPAQTATPFMAARMHERRSVRGGPPRSAMHSELPTPPRPAARVPDAVRATLYWARAPLPRAARRRTRARAAQEPSRTTPDRLA